jgi:hypothetical protein
VFIDLLCSLIALAAILMLVAFVLTMRFRRLDNPEAIFQKIKPRQVTLLPFVAEDNQAGWRDDELWRAVGGIRGLMQLPRDAFGLLALCASLDYQKMDPGEYALNVKRVETIALSSLAAAFEAMFKQFVPWMPRPYLRLIATEYWRMCLSLQTLVSTYSPSMIERVAEVL